MKIIDNIRKAIPELNNTSKSSIVVRLAEVFQNIIDTFLLEFSRSEQLMKENTQNCRFGSPSWYEMKARAYQDGDNLNFMDPQTLEPCYEEIDPKKQIIAQASFESTTTEDETTGDKITTLTLKVAKLEGDKLVALDSSQVAEFSAYYSLIEIPCLPVSIITANADVIKGDHTISYEATTDLVTLKSKIDQKLRELEKGFDFNNVLFLSDITKEIESVPGVRNSYLHNMTVTPAKIEGSEDPVSQPIENQIPLYSGYFTLELNPTYEII